MILKFQANFRISTDANVSVSLEQLIDDENDAREAGKEFKNLVDAFIEGYGDTPADEDTT